MEYQKIINLLENTPNQTTKFRTKNSVHINDDSCGTCSTSSRNLIDYLPNRLSSKSGNKGLQRYDWWKKNFFD